MTLIDEYFLENKPTFSGKIREAYNYNDDQLIIKTSNKISAYDFVFEDELPEKGALLTKISKYWFKKTGHIIDNHMIDSNELEQLIPNSHERCILVKKCKPIRIEAIVRGYISGSAYKQYLESGMIGDIDIKENMQLNDKFDLPIFTPSTKAAVEGLTVSLAAEFAPNIRVNCIAPSLTNSKIAEPMLKNKVLAEGIAKAHPLKRLGEGKDSASLAKFLITEDSSWVTGQIIAVDGGRSKLS